MPVLLPLQGSCRNSDGFGTKTREHILRELKRATGLQFLVTPSTRSSLLDVELRLNTFRKVDHSCMHGC
jgi:hypothetical protein